MRTGFIPAIAKDGVAHSGRRQPCGIGTRQGSCSVGWRSQATKRIRGKCGYFGNFLYTQGKIRPLHGNRNVAPLPWLFVCQAVHPGTLHVYQYGILLSSSLSTCHGLCESNIITLTHGIWKSIGSVWTKR